MGKIDVDGQSVEISGEDKVYFPDDGITKGELIDYYRRVASFMLPHLKGRPLTLFRYPDGIATKGFVQKRAPDYFPDWIDRVTVEMEGDTITHPVCNNAATLVYLANQGCITPHVWTSRADKPTLPDRMVFDLDPSGDDFEQARQAAFRVRELLDQLELPSHLMTTGSKGLHVVVPLARKEAFDPVREFARSVAERLATHHPDELTIEPRIEARKGRLFLDVLRNTYAHTSVPPYAVRARPGAPVAVPIPWDELDDPDLTSTRYTLRTLALPRTPDPWSDLTDNAVTLNDARKRLKEMM